METSSYVVCETGAGRVLFRQPQGRGVEAVILYGKLCLPPVNAVRSGGNAVRTHDAGGKPV